jgi:ADP-heptose:LPS heptosyltransferase
MIRSEQHGALVPGVKKIAVLNPSAVGDFVVTLPAMHALRAAYPHAEIVYIGKAWHAEFLKERPGPIDEVVVIPAVPGVGAPADMHCDPAPIQVFLEAMQVRQFDLAIQMYGGGRSSNPFLKRFGARMTVGLKAPEAQPLDRWLPFVYLQNNRLRMLEVAALVGANRLQLGQELEVTAHDRQEAQHVLSSIAATPLVLLHPGASDARRHWPAERFAQVGDALVEEGACVAVDGIENEAEVTASVIRHMHYPAIDLTAKMSLSGVLGLLERCSLLISNDTGTLHLALALGTPCVGIYWHTNLYVGGGALMQKNYRAAVSAEVNCPVCGQENVKTRCPHNVSFVASVPVEEVKELAFELFRRPPQEDCAPVPGP